jgi:hypothetical protein
MTSTKSRRFHPFSLDAINFLLADVRGAVRSYLNLFLVTQQHWSQITWDAPFGGCSRVGETRIAGILRLSGARPSDEDTKAIAKALEQDLAAALPG